MTPVGTTGLPLYRHAIDWDVFDREYPAPDTWAETVFQWPAGRLRDLQSQRFTRILDAAWRNPWYAARWQMAGITPDDIRGLEDVRKLPTFTSDDVREDQLAHAPFGELQNWALEPGGPAPMKLQTSGGSTGRPRPTLFGPLEWELQALCTARALYVQGARPGDIMQIVRTCSLSNSAWAHYKACHDYLGVLPLTTGTGVVTPSRRQLEIAFEWGTTLWSSGPEYLVHLAEVARDELGRDVHDLPMRFLPTFLGPDLDNTLRQQIQDLWGCPVFDDYGTHEIGMGAFECPAQAGLHFMEDTLFVEVVDPETGEPVPDGEPGNLVVTSLYRTVPPLVRYNLRDLVRIASRETCACGSQFTRMDHFLGRSDDMVRLRGTNVYPAACLPAVQSDSRTTGEWLCIVDDAEMRVQVEMRSDGGSVDGLVEALEARLHMDLGARVTVELVSQGSLAWMTNVGREGKPRRLVDRRRLATE